MTRPNSKPALFLFNLSDHAPEPWLAAGIDCTSVDPQHGIGSTVKHPSGAVHTKVAGFADDHLEDYQDMVHNGQPVPDWGIVISFPVCTNLASSGARHWATKREANPNFQDDAVESARIAEFYGCAYIVENPVGALATLWRPPTGYVHPWEFGGYISKNDGKHPDYPDYIPDFDAYPKKTGLWCGNGAVMPVKRPVSKPDGLSASYKKLGGKSLKTKNIRSATPRGMAAAIFEANNRHCLPDYEREWEEREQARFDRIYDRR